MQKISISQLKVAKQKIREAGYTLKGWARKHGHNDDTVLSLLQGADAFKYQGPVVQKIIKDLVDEGWLSLDSKKRRAA